LQKKLFLAVTCFKRILRRAPTAATPAFILILPQIRQNFYILGKNKTGFKPVNPSGAAAQGARQFPVCP
jgi:hypothetical protein